VLQGPGTIRAYTGEIVKEDIKTATVKFRILGQEHTQTFQLLTKTGSDTVVLGMPWLRKYNPDIDWQREKITLVEEGKNRKVSEEGPLNHDIISKESVTCKESIREKEVSVDKPSSQEGYEKELAKARQVLPKQLHEFLDIFAQQECRLPDSGKHDLATYKTQERSNPTQGEAASIHQKRLIGDKDSINGII
jgi:hypothetical protein